MGSDRLQRVLSRGRVAEALLTLGAVSFLRRIVPITRWSSLLGKQTDSWAGSSEAPLTPRDLRVGRSVAAADRHLPFGTTCLDRAVAGRLMLRRRRWSAVVVIGFDRTDPLQGSHAWLVGESGSVVIGGEVREGFVPVTAFR